MPSKQTNKPTSGSGSLSQFPKSKSRKTSFGSSSSNAVADSKPKSFKPLLSVTKPPAFNLSGKGKAREKPKPEIISLLDDSDEELSSTDLHADNRLWVDMYEPQSEAELAVHKRKVEDVRRWLQEAFEGGPTGKLKKYRRILVLTGPAGTAKTTTIRVLSKELGFDILEWRNTLEESFQEGDYDRETLNEKFEIFLARASTCHSLLGGSSQLSFSNYTSQNRLPSSSSSMQPPGSFQNKRQIVLLEDLPNILHQPTQEVFHNALESFVDSAQGTPLVIIVSDATTRGEVRDERLAQGNRWSSHDTIDVRTVLPAGLINGPYVTQIAFNPIAPTLLLRALQEMLSRHYASSDVPQNKRLTKDDLNIIVETSNGDIRSAVMALQFACVLEVSKNRSMRGRKKGSRALMEAVTRREQALALFHLLGKVLYNKRKGDPISTTASAKDRFREQELDARLKLPPPLPKWLAEHERRTSRVDVDSLYAESPIDTGLFALYIHQNYPQFCDDVDQCGGVSDWLSLIDSSGGEQWYQTNPHQFHLLTLGTLHSLPSPVARRSQKICKPEFFDVLRKTREAEDAVLDVWNWLLQDSESTSVRRWARDEIAMEAGSVLKARSQGGFVARSRPGEADIPIPPTHSAFSTLAFARSTSLKAPVLDADGYFADEVDLPEEDGVPRHPECKKAEEEEEDRGWLAEDDIEDFL